MAEYDDERDIAVECLERANGTEDEDGSMVHAGRRLSATGQVAGRRREARANGASNTLDCSIAKPRRLFHREAPPGLCDRSSVALQLVRQNTAADADRSPYFEGCAKSQCSANESGSALALPPFLAAASRSDPFHPGREQYWRA
jgi:hypothetical protein